MTVIQTISFTFLFGLLSCNGEDKDKPVVITRPDREIDKVKLTDLKDKPLDQKQYDGKTVFINFWATWCKPCLEEMPSIQKAKEILKNENIEFLFASNETAGEIEVFNNEHDYGFNYVIAGNLEELNIVGLPTTFIFNTDGKLVFSEMGYRKWDDKTNIDLILKIAKQE